MSPAVDKFDPVKYIKDARRIGFTQEQAEFHAQDLEHIIEVISNDRELVTKRDLAELKLELIKWMLGIGVSGILAITGILKLIVH